MVLLLQFCYDSQLIFSCKAPIEGEQNSDKMKLALHGKTFWVSPSCVQQLNGENVTVCQLTNLQLGFLGARPDLSEIEKSCKHVGIISKGKMLFQDTVKALKQSKSKKMMVEFEVDKFIDALTILESLGKENVSLTDEFIEIEVDDKSEITTTIDAFRAKKVAVFQVSIKNNLEELFLSLTEN